MILYIRKIRKKKEKDMVKGYKRNVVLLKNTNSEVFDMAYFIMRDDVNEKSVDVISEANRILEENRIPKRRRRFGHIALLLSFFCGAAASALSLLFVII